MTSLECSGLITLVKKYKNSKLKEKFITMPKGTDFATITNPELYSEYGLTRKALIVDVRSDLPLFLQLLFLCWLIISFSKSIGKDIWRQI